MLSKRLKAIADYVPAGSVVYDVGSDHALLPCFLVKNKSAVKVYAGDNKEGPLEKAQANIARYHLKEKVIPVLADGLSQVRADVEVITLAGMGVHTALAILKQADLKRFKLLIVQVNRRADLLRAFLSANNYVIIKEKVIFEDGKYYEIIVFSAAPGPYLTAEEIQFGPYLLKHPDDTFIAYLADRLKRREFILRQQQVNDLLADPLYAAIKSVLKASEKRSAEGKN